jgi:hypothetical protein
MAGEMNEYVKNDCTVAAILTAAVMGTGGGTPARAVYLYALTLKALRDNGGAVTPSEKQP